MRVQLKPALRQVWRSPQTVQIGLDPRYAAVLDGLTEADRALLARLQEGVETRDVVPRAPTPGGPSSRRDREAELIALLTDAGVLVRTRAGRAALSRIGSGRDRLAPDAQAWSVVHGRDGDDGWELLGARSLRWVEVVGGGRVGRTLATTLAGAGVGHVTLQDPSPVTAADVAPAAAACGDLGRPREEAFARGLETLFGTTPGARRGGTRQDGERWQDQPLPDDAPDLASLEGRPRRRGTDRTTDPRLPDVVVLVEHAVADAATGRRLTAADVAHLSVVVREGTIVVGPFVAPGTAPCLRCLDLHRGDRDPAWSRILAQLLGARIRCAPGPEETASAQLAASLAALQVLAHLDELHLGRGGRPTSQGATLEVELPDGLVSRREWPAHPACGCAVLG